MDADVKENDQFQLDDISERTINLNREQYLSHLDSNDQLNVIQLLAHIDQLANNIREGQIRVIAIGSTAKKQASRQPNDIDLQILSTTSPNSPARLRVANLLKESIREFFDRHGYNYKYETKIPVEDIDTTTNLGAVSKGSVAVPGWVDCLTDFCLAREPYDCEQPFFGNICVGSSPPIGRKFDITISGKGGLNAQAMLEEHQKRNRHYVVIR